MGFKLIDLGVKEAATFHNLKNVHHKDPFDRILIWQAIKNDFTFISDDKNVKKYISEGLKVIG
jgi:PIN domain nuclease of toxin-antitoxin system